MFLLVSLSKSKVFHSCRTRVVRAALVSYSCLSSVTRVAFVSLVSHSRRSCRSRFALVSLSCLALVLYVRIDRLRNSRKFKLA